MRFIASFVREILGLFVDDGSLALLILFLIAVISFAVKLLAVPALWGGGLLLLGCIMILVWSLAKFATRK